MKKIIVTFGILLFANMAYALTTETFENTDKNSVKSGISKYILLRGGKLNYGNDYMSDSYTAYETVQTSRGTVFYTYVFNLSENNGNTKLNLSIFKNIQGTSPSPVGIEHEQKTMDAIKASVRGRYLYGLGFDFEKYFYNGNTIVAPKGKETGIVLTKVKYDALKQGLRQGDVIVEINGVPLSEIPLDKFANILYANTMSDILELTYLRDGIKHKVNLTPRPSVNKTF